MKSLSRTALCTAFAVSLSTPLLAQEIQWVRNYAEGMKLAREDHLPVLVDFWAAWCGPCKKMDLEVYRQATVVEASKRMIFIQVDIDRDPATAGQYGVRAIPHVVLIDPWETVLIRTEGFAEATDLLEMIKPLPASFNEVAGDFERLSTVPTDFDALMNIGQFYRKSGFPLAARDFTERALKSPRAGEDPAARDNARYSLGMVALNLKDYKKARRIFEEACKDCDPASRPKMLMGLGKTYFDMNKMKEARKVFEEVVVKFPESTYAAVARNNLAKMK